jgi:hypothetical protein
MSLELHERGIHAVCFGTDGAGVAKVRFPERDTRRRGNNAARNSTKAADDSTNAAPDVGTSRGTRRLPH